MSTNFKHLLFVFILYAVPVFGQQHIGANVPWITYEAEGMKTDGTVLGPGYAPYKVETESSGERCVKLSRSGEFVEFIAHDHANSLVARYSLPDAKQGNGLYSTISLYKNGKFINSYEISSKYSWIYGKYPFSNSPDSGETRHFYDELRTSDIKIDKGDTIRLQWQSKATDKAKYLILDLVDLEDVAPPLKMPANALSIADEAFTKGNTYGDYTEAFRKCIAAAQQNGKIVWIPAGTFKITGDIILPANITVQGAGMWCSQLVGDEQSYVQADKRVRLIGNGDSIHIADFSIIGKLTYRSDKEANDGIVGSFGRNSTISNIWVEHTKVGMWIENSYNLHISGCRMRNTMADGINFCVGMSHSTIENCTARGTGDDCFAIWPTIYIPQKFAPGNNVISNCTAQLPYLANGAAIYGGDSNRIEDCFFSDISQGSAVLISTTFPTESIDKKINNNFSGTTVIENCTIENSGGFDHEWNWRAAIEICLDKRDISGLSISNLIIKNSLSNAISVVAKNVGDNIGTLSNARLQNITIQNYGLGKKGSNAFFISGNAHGSLIIEKSDITKVENRSENFSVSNQ